MILFFYNLALLVVLITRRALVALPHGHHAKVPRRACGAAGLGAGRSWRLFQRSAHWRLEADRPLIWLHAVSVGEVLAVSRLVKTLDAALPDYLVVVSTTTRTGQALGSRALRIQPRLLLPARSALGCPRLPQRAQSAPARSGRDRILAQPAQRLFPPRNSRRRRQCPHLRPFLASLQAAARPLEAISQPPQPRPGPEPNRCRPPQRHRLSAGLRIRRRQPQI